MEKETLGPSGVVLQLPETPKLAPLDPGGAATAEPPARRPAHEEPTQIGCYRILQKMGEGGMGVVYKAEQREPVRRIVALKVIKLGMDTKEVVARFEAERQALALMSHPNVAKVFEAGMTDQGRPYFAMEFVPGVPITQYCDDNKLTTRQRLELFIPVCQAIQHAHQKGIIHRDLKPGNILVSMFEGQPVPKVIDFGIAKAANQVLTQRTLYTQTGALVGTPEYMSPEQAQTSGLDVDTRTDIYSLGVILYELLTGQLPFDAQTLRNAGLDGMARIIKETEPAKPSTRIGEIKHQAGPPGDTPFDQAARKRRSDPRSLARELRGDLDWITLKAMEKDRTRRYETANGLALDIRRYLDDEPILARPPSTLYRLGKIVRRHKGGVAAVLAIVLALVLGIMATSLAMLRARAAFAEARKDRDRALRAEQAAIEQRRVADEQRVLATENEAKANSSIAHTLLLKGDFASAEPMFRRSLEIYRKLRPGDHADVAAALADLASVLKTKRDFKGAEDLARQSLSMYQRLSGDAGPQVPGAYNSLGAVLMSEGQREAAEPLLRRSIQLYRGLKPPDTQGLATAIGNLGLLLQQSGDLAKAEPLLRQSLQLWMTVPGYEMNTTFDVGQIPEVLASILQQRGDLAGAAKFRRQNLIITLAHIERGLQWSPTNLSYLEGHVQIAFALGRFTDVAADYDKLIQLDPRDHLLYMQSGCAHLYLGDRDVYRELCRRMVERFGGSTEPFVRDRAAKTCLLLSDAVKDLTPVLAMARANLSVQDAPFERPALFRLCAGMAEYRAGNYDTAAESLQKALDLGLTIEPRAAALLFLAMTRYRMHDDAEARAQLDRAHQLLRERISKPDDPLLGTNSSQQDWFICQIAWREADELILGRHTEPASMPDTRP